MADVNDRIGFTADHARMTVCCIANVLRKGCHRSIHAAAIFALQAALFPDEGEDHHEQYRTIVGMVASGRASAESFREALDAALYGDGAPTGTKFVLEFSRREPGFAREAGIAGFPRVYNPDHILLAPRPMSPRRFARVPTDSDRLHAG